MRTTLLLLTALLAALPLYAKEVIRIGTILPLSGAMAANGEDTRDALILGLEQLQDPQNKFDYEILFEDNQNAPRQTVEAYHFLTNTKKAPIIFSWSGPGAAITPLAQKQKIVHLGLGFSTDIAKGFYNFNNFSKPIPNATLMAKFCQKMNYKRVAAISQRHSSTNSLMKAFEQVCGDYGIEMVATEQFTPGTDKDFRTSLMKLNQANPDVLFLHAFDPEADIIARQMQELGMDTPITSMAHWGATQTPLVYGHPYTESNPDQSFTDDFVAKFGREPRYFAAMNYDSLGLLINACEQWQGKGIPDNQFIAQTILDTQDYQGVSGTLNCDEDGWFDAPPALLKKTQNGRVVLDLNEIPNED